MDSIQKDKKVIVTISDTGIGMTPDQVQRLGEPYFSTKEKGTGLGMMVVFGIVRSMNGKLHVFSQVGKGTQFKIEFPLEQSIMGERSFSPSHLLSSRQENLK